MSIYDAIANPKVPSVLPHLQFMMNMEDRRRKRDYDENQANIQARIAAGQAKGRGHIRAFRDPQEGPPEPPPERQPGSLQAGLQAEGPPQPELVAEPGSEQMAAMQPGGAQPAGEQPAGDISELTAPLQNISTEEMSNADSLEALADKIAGIIGNKDIANMYYDLAEKARERAATETKEERKRADQLMEVSAGPIKAVSELEEQGKMKEAAAKYDEIRDFIMKDPRFAENEHIMKFYEASPEYQPGIGKYMYTATMMGGKARDQFQKEQATTGAKGQQKLNLFWDGLDSPVKGRFDPGKGTYQYETPQGWVNAPDDAQIVSTSLQGSKAELGLTKKNISDINRQTGNDLETINALEELIPLIEKTPEAVGLVGGAAESIAGVVGQFGETGEYISELVESDDAIEVRTGLRMLTGKLIPRVLGDTSGRYSDKDMERVEEVRGGLKAMRNKRQTVKALNVVLKAFKNGQIRDQFALRNDRFPTDVEFKQLIGREPTTIQKTKKSTYSDLWNK